MCSLLGGSKNHSSFCGRSRTRALPAQRSPHMGLGVKRRSNSWGPSYSRDRALPLPSANHQLPPAPPTPDGRPTDRLPTSLPLPPAALGQGSLCRTERGCSHMLKQCKHFPSPNAVSRGNNYRFPRFNREYF